LSIDKKSIKSTYQKPRYNTPT